ncbi:hemin-degrading factor (plasmid) [Pedobacter sp. BS3]|uniref:hemin-degrading factor n=1 Tax=Pedobacter sp. BS3 TaxID=2567937 RepID=UPI0011EC3271|nr:ChuX/HutX family heme-like substrate-binding protein [Pedobacter sp. BS3]TZF85959.1 hemin-degrading factor [Pedobacter sp. BS3]
MEKELISLKEQWDKLKAEQPKLRIREAAKQLHVTEAGLVNTGVGEYNIRLNSQFQELLKEVNTLGKVLALTRNDYCVHERKGVYKKASFNGHIGLVVTPDIDLRLFMDQWQFGFAVNENNRRSLQFFDQHGEAVHKIYLTEESDESAYHLLVAKYRAEEQLQELLIAPAREAVDETPDEEINVEGFRDAWRALQDTHHFFGMLRKYGVTRTQALRLAPDDYAKPLEVDVLKKTLQTAAGTQQEIMVFVGNPGCIQIHTGPVQKLLETGPWFNVLDPDFNLHLRLDGVASAWLVKKPTSEGLVHSIEAFDEAGNIVIQYFGKRKPGIPESEGWRALLKNLGLL